MIPCRKVHSMIDEYFKIYIECIEKYGQRTVVLMQVGTFYEIYKVETEKLGNADIVADILNIAYSKKNKTEKSTRSHPNFAGFTKTYLSKYITPLLENDYTVVIVDELEKSSDTNGKLIKRGITAVYSQCLKSPDFQTSHDTENNLSSIFLEITNCDKKTCFFYSICSVNNITNEIELNENVIEFSYEKVDFKIVLDEFARILSRYNSKEILFYNVVKTIIEDGVPCQVSTYYKQIEKFLYELENKHKYIEIKKDDSIYKEYNKIKYQNEYLRKVYTHIDFGMEDPIQYMFLEMIPISRVNLLYMLDYMSRYDTKYISNLNIPRIINESKNLVLELNTSEQLHLLPNSKINSFSKISSVFDVVNFTQTAIGKRALKNLLSKPFTDINEMQRRYDLSNTFSEIKDEKFIEIRSILSDIIDFERLHRKMGLNMLHPYEFEKLHTTYMKILLLFDRINTLHNVKDNLLPQNRIITSFMQFIDDYKMCFYLEEMKRITLSTNKDEIVNFFNSGVVEELDIIQNNINNIQNDIENKRLYLEKSLEKTNIKTKIGADSMIKLNFTDNDGYYFSCTKIRYSKLVNECKDIQFTMRSTSNMCKFTTDELTKLSTKLIITRDLLVKKVKLHYLLKLEEYSKKYHIVFKELLIFISLLDIITSNVKCSKKYLYCKPEIINTNKEDSFVNCISLRHPIIERICDTEYIPNDICLDKNNKGMLLYGLNSSGKSSLLRAIGICIILAQCGLYVPCKKMVYYPFKKMISQVDLTDNLFVGKSSFISEMSGLKKILSCAGKNTLVLSDELCRGTEVNSSCAIVTSCLLSLLKSNTKLFFTTHLHKIASLPIIQKTKSIKICHLSVTCKDDIIIFNRIISDGSGSDLYGLEVCKSIIHDDFFIDTAFDIRNQLIENKTRVLSTKKSRYNNAKIISECEVCGYKPKDKSIPLDTHHINEQKNCDESGFVNGKAFHKNKLFNLVSLCKSCHLKIDTGELIINGYVESTSGKILDYTKIKVSIN